jgi:hypothetical protein
VRRIATVGLALAAAGLLAAPPVAHVAGETVTDTVVARSAAQDVDNGQIPSADASAPRIIAPAGPLVFATESHPWDVIRGHATAGTVLIVLDAPCPSDSDQPDEGEPGEEIPQPPEVYGLAANGHQLARDGAARKDESVDDGPRGGDLVLRRPPWPPHDPGGDRTTGPCVLRLQAQVAIDDPATGWVSVGPFADVAIEADQLRPYRVARGSDRLTFLVLILVAAAAGGFAVVRFVRSPLVREAPAADVTKRRKRRGRRKLTVPGDHPLRGSWVSSLAAVGAAATTLLAATGALSELAPQYQTGKVVVGNILVVTLLAIAAALISAGSHNDTVKLGYATAAVFTAVSAIAAQLLLTALVLLHASQHQWIRVITAVVAVGTVAVLAWTVRRLAEGQPADERQDEVRTVELELEERQRVEISLTIPHSGRPDPRT